jgi:hypothetical protein
LCIDAVNTVKILRLAKCINITGVGLEPLRGSKIIVQIDLSLVGDGENPRSLDIPPFLDSIISLDGCALRYLQFPTTWRRVRGQQFKAFVTRYNKMLRSRIDVSCYGCVRPCLRRWRRRKRRRIGGWILLPDKNTLVTTVSSTIVNDV